MIAPLVLFVVSVVGLAVALLVPGLTDALLLAVPCSVASLFLLLRARAGAKVRAKPGRMVLVDGSNVLYWQDNTPQIDTLRAVLKAVQAQKMTPAVVFDANAGYRIAGRYQHDKALADLLGLPEAQVMVAPKGEPADRLLLTAAGEMGARIITNDRYRDWAEEFPRVREPGFLIRGGCQNGRVTLELAEPALA